MELCARTPDLQHEEVDEDFVEMNDIRKKLMFDLSPFNKYETLLKHIKAKEPVQVYLRIRPKSLLELQMKDPNCLYPVSETSILAVAPQPSRLLKGYGKGPVKQSEHFCFSRVYNEDSTQSNIFNECVVPVIEDFFKGQNCLLFSYGVTNSGKSYTITGTAKEPGILPRTLDVVFNSIKDNHFESHCIKPKLFSEVTDLSETEQETDKILKHTLLTKATSTAHTNRSCDQVSHDQESCGEPDPDQSNIETTCTTVAMPDSIDLSVVSDASSNISKLTFEAGSIGASMFEDLTVHEDHVIEVDTQNDSLSFSIWVSFAEIYNEIIYDLLADEPISGKTRKSLKLSDDRGGNPYIKDLREIKVASTEEALKLLQLGLRHRHIAGTRLNYQSSRSHAIFTIKIIRINISSRRRQRVTGVNRISFVDLAGSERSKKTGATGERIREAGSINTSLLVLGRCIEAMRLNQRATKKSDELIVPFRDSKLTKLLQTYFVGKGKCAREGKVVMILNVSNNSSVFSETAHVLKFSALASKVVPLHNPAVKSLTDIPELSPMRLPLAPEDDPVIVIDGDESVVGVSDPLYSCDNCEHLKKIFEKAKNEVVDLKLQLWEQENTIRMQLAHEFNLQMNEFQNNLHADMDNHTEIVEDEMQCRMMMYQQSTKKHYNRKRRRNCMEDEEEERQEQFQEIDNLQRMRKKLEKELKEAKEDLELEQNKHAREIRDITSVYESQITNVRSQYNQSILDNQELKKQINVLKKDIESQKEKIEKRHLEEMVEMDNKILSYERLRNDSETLVTQLQEDLKTLSEEKKQLKETVIQDYDNKIVKLEKELQDAMKDKQKIKNEVYYTVQKECDDKVSELEEEVRSLMEINGRLTSELYEKVPITVEEHSGEACLLKTEMKYLKEEIKRLKATETEYDIEKEEMLLQLVSLEACNGSEKRQRGTLEDELQRRQLVNEVEVDDLRDQIQSLTNKLAEKRTGEEKITENEVVMEGMRKRVDDLTNELTAMRIVMSDKEQEMESLTKEQRTKDEEMDERYKECNNLKEKVAILTKDLDHLREKNKEMKDKRNLEKKNNRVELDDLKKKVISLTEELVKLRETVEEKEKQLKGFEEEERLKLEEHEMELRNKVDSLTSDTFDLFEVIKNGEHTTKVLKEEKKTMEKKIAENEVVMEGLRTRVDDLTNELTTMESVMSDKERELEALTKEQRTKDEEMDERYKECNSLKEKVAILTKDLDHLREKNKKLEDEQNLEKKDNQIQLDDLKKKVISLTEELAKLEETVEEKEKERLKLEERIEDNCLITELYKEMEDERHIGKEEKRTMEKKIAESEVVMEGLRTRVDDLTNELTAMRIVMSDKEQEMESLTKEQRTKDEEICKRNKECNNLKEKVAILTKDLDHLRETDKQKDEIITTKIKEIENGKLKTEMSAMSHTSLGGKVSVASVSVKEKCTTQKYEENGENGVRVLYDVPPDAINISDEHIYDSVHASFTDNTKDEEDTSMNETRKLPLLERSSVLRDSLEDFVSPQTRHIQYNQLTDAKKPKKTRGGMFRRKPNKTDNDSLLPECNTPPPGRYQLRSRKKKNYDDENVPPSSPVRTPPILKKLYSKKSQTTVKKKKNTLRKSQISAPLDVWEYDGETQSHPLDNSQASSQRRPIKTHMAMSLKPPVKNTAHLV